MAFRPVIPPAPDTNEAPAPSEYDRVFGWRLQELVEAGYDVERAELVAASGVDLHYACDLVHDRDCSPELAVSILL